MNEQRWQQIQAIFSSVVDLPIDEQSAIARELCDADLSLLDEVMEMLDEDRRANSLLDARLDQTAAAVLDFGQLPSTIQRQIGPYKLIRLLGEGGMGVVYLAERTDIGGQVAIKLLRDAWLSPMRRQRFRFEQSTLAQLNHPSIARIYDSSTLDDGTPWFVMEYADGHPLTDYWIQQNNQQLRSIRECLRLMRRVAEAVQYAHSHAIIHRDLKPSNILVLESGEVKLLDFGIAKHLNADEEAEHRTITGLRMMTLAYAAPEQLAGKPVGVYTDVYALGVLLYELLTGELPNRAYSSNTDLVQGSNSQLEKPSAVLRRGKDPKLPQLDNSEWADLDLLALKALEPDPARRYRSADALIRDMDAWLEGRTLDARPNDWSYTLSKFVRRNRNALMSVAAAILLVAATIVFYTVRLERARNEALRQAARTLRIQQFTESLFDGGDKSAGPSQDLKALQLLDRGRLEAASLANDPEMQADMQSTLGAIYQKLGKLDLAEPLLVSALDARRQTLGQTDPRVAENLIALGLLRKDQGKLDEAEALVRQGLEITRNAPQSAPAEIARCMVALGSVLEVRGKYDDAQPILEAALKLQPQNKTENKIESRIESKLGQHKEQATASTTENITELANVYFYQGKYQEAEKLNNQALAIDRRLFGDENPAVAQELNNLGAIAMNRGNYTASEDYYRRSLAITEAWYGADHPETAANLTALAQPLTFDKKESEAQALLERALAIQQRINGSVNATVATTQNQLGIVAFQAKRLDEARAYFTQAMETWKKLFGEQYPSVAVAYSNLGSVCLEKKDLACAETMYREAVTRFDKCSANSLNDAVAHLKLGRSLLRQNRFKEAEPETLFGYAYLGKNVKPTDRFMVVARKDLSLIYMGLHDQNKAAHYQAELAQADVKQSH
jgi:serine/threonine protein kinase/Tfp pilus assembly protein PilF